MLSGDIPLLRACLSELSNELADAIGVLNLPICDTPPATGSFLSCKDNCLVFNTEDGEKIQPNLSKPAGFTGKQPFLRALAPARGGIVIDATAGLAGDSLKLALIADRVIAIERHPAVYALLVSALQTAKSLSASFTEKIETRYGDAIEVIPHLPPADVIFLDPMFPPKRKRSALPPKSVRILRDIVGDDTDDEKLFRVAREHALRRVVVKRPLHAETMAVDHVALHKGKVVRYEVYLPTRVDS